MFLSSFGSRGQEKHADPLFELFLLLLERRELLARQRGHLGIAEHLARVLEYPCSTVSPLSERADERNDLAPLPAERLDPPGVPDRASGSHIRSSISLRRRTMTSSLSTGIMSERRPSLHRDVARRAPARLDRLSCVDAGYGHVRTPRIRRAGCAFANARVRLTSRLAFRTCGGTGRCDPRCRQGAACPCKTDDKRRRRRRKCRPSSSASGTCCRTRR